MPSWRMAPDCGRRTAMTKPGRVVWMELHEATVQPDRPTGCGRHSCTRDPGKSGRAAETPARSRPSDVDRERPPGRGWRSARQVQDRKSTRLNSSHLGISYAVFCLKKTTIKTRTA